MGSMLAGLARLTPQWRRLQRDGRDPGAAQAALLRRCLSVASATEWGRRYDFAAIARAPEVFAAFAAAVPLREPESFAPEVERMLEGAPDVSWPGRRRRFVSSSGTLGGRKLLPLTDETLEADVEYGRKLMLGYLACTGKAGWLGGVPLSLQASAYEHPERPGVRCGQISGLLAEHLLQTGRPLARRIRRERMMPAAVREIADWDEKLDAVADWALERDVRLMAGAPSWSLAILDRVIERARQRIGRVDVVTDIWPRFGLMISGGLPVAGYVDALRRRIGGEQVDVLDTYGASEGFLAFQDDPAVPDLRLDVSGGLVYEFVPVAELGAPSPRRFGIADVPLNEPHALHVTSVSGLWAQALGDVVRVTSREPPRLRFVGRTGELLNSWREEVSAEMARGALAAACAATNAGHLQVHVAPLFSGEGRRHRHQWLIEFREPPRDLAAFARALDEAMIAESPNYARFRTEREFDPLEVVALPAGSFARLIERERGEISVQSKVALLSDTRELAEALLASAPATEPAG